jgi:hypothetical protein
MPTLAPPVFDDGGSRAESRTAPGVRPLKIGLVFLGALVVTVVVLRLVLGPLGGDDAARDETAVGTSATDGERTPPPPPASLDRPAGVRAQPDTLAGQYLRERLTAPPGEMPSQLVQRLGDLLAPDHAWLLASEPTVPDAPGTLVEVGEPDEVEPGVVDVPVRRWTYVSDPGTAEPADRQVWRVEVREELGVWSVTDARPT